MSAIALTTVALRAIVAPIIVLLHIPHLVVDILIKLDLYLVVVDHPFLVVLVLVIRFLVVTVLRPALHLERLLRRVPLRHLLHLILQQLLVMVLIAAARRLTVVFILAVLL